MFDAMIHRCLTTLLLPSLFFVQLGCQHVAPYEREYLARRSMDVSAREARTAGFESHVHEAREGGGGGGDTAGGGCGCN